MGTLIQHIEDFVEYWPAGTVFAKNEIELAGPCPFCEDNSSAELHEYRGVRFIGRDRFVFWLTENRFRCRQCAAAERRGQYGLGLYSIFDLAHKFSTSIAENYDISWKPATNTNRPLKLYPYSEILRAHAVVNRDYWHRFRWPDAIIDHFKLGLMELYLDDGAVNIIPMQVRTVEKDDTSDYYVEGRADGVSTKRSSGQSHDYFWHIHEAPECDTVVLAEGSKDAVTAYYLGYQNVVAAFGAGAWSRNKTEFLAHYGYRHFYVFGDHDPAGDALNRDAFRWAKNCGLDVKVIQWCNDFDVGYDITNLLEQYEVNGALDYINSHLIELDINDYPEVSRPSFVPDYRHVDSNYTIPEINALSIEEVRGTGLRSLHGNIFDFVDTYQERRERNKGELLLLNSGPGSGKTHALIEKIEEMIPDLTVTKDHQWALMNESIQAAQAELDTITDEEQRIIQQRLVNRMQRQIDEFAFSSILWVTQYKNGYDTLMKIATNKDHWYNFRARDEVNCQNYALSMVLGENNHDVGAYCQLACPFRQQCELNGYLSQESDRKRKPITVVRHQHLRNNSFIADYQSLVVIDESPLNIVDTPYIFSIEDLNPFLPGWDIEVADTEMVYCINNLAEALRRTMRMNVGEPQQTDSGEPNPNYMISGAAFLQQVDNHIRIITDGNYTLQRVIGKIEDKILDSSYQPNFINGDSSKVSKRSLIFIFRAIQRELDSYCQDKQNTQPSCIHLVCGMLEIYPMESFKISSGTPVIVADATAALPELYDAAFQRKMTIYSPTIHNPNAHVTVISGSDWTKGQLEKYLGKELRDRENRRLEFVKNVTGDIFYLQDVPTNTDFYNGNKLLKDYEDAIYSLAQKHKNLLVVVHKRVRDVLEDIFKYKYPTIGDRLAWGHYGALRGTNEFKDYEAVVLIGVSRIPYDVVWRKVQAWANLLQIKDEIPFKFMYKPKPYHRQYAGHTYRTFTHPFAQRYVDFVEEGEMIQCMERIRPHSSDEEKWIYVFASRPSAHFVETIQDKRLFFEMFRQDSPVERVKTFLIRQYNLNGDVPTKREIMTALHCGSEVFAQARKLTEAELGVKLRSKRRR